MGAYVIFNTLNSDFTRRIPVNNLFILGGALDEKSLYDCCEAECTNYSSTLRNVKRVFSLNYLL